MFFAFFAYYHKNLHYDVIFILVPSIAPPSCEKQILDSNTVYFSWKRIPYAQVPGILRGYRIRYREYYKPNAWQEVVLDNTMDQITITNLKAYTFYWFEISGFTNAGYGPFEVFVFRTPPGGMLIYYTHILTVIHPAVLIWHPGKQTLRRRRKLNMRTPPQSFFVSVF